MVITQVVVQQLFQWLGPLSPDRILLAVRLPRKGAPTRQLCRAKIALQMPRFSMQLGLGLQFTPFQVIQVRDLRLRKVATKID